MSKNKLFFVLSGFALVSTLSAVAYAGPFHGVAQAGKLALVQHLAVKPTVDINERDSDGNTALMLAAREGHEPVVTYLLGRPGIQIDVANAAGRSAIVLAALGGHHGIVQRLLALAPPANLAVADLNLLQEQLRPRLELEAAAGVGAPRPYGQTMDALNQGIAANAAVSWYWSMLMNIWWAIEYALKAIGLR